MQLTDFESASWITMGYTEVFKTWEVREMVNRMFGKDYTYEKLQKSLSVTVLEKARIIYITTEATQADLLVALANVYAQAGKTFIVYYIYANCNIKLSASSVRINHAA